MGQKITREIEHEEWNLTDPSRMFECHDELFGYGYNCNLAGYWVDPPAVDAEEGEEPPPPADPTPHRFLEISKNGKPTVQALLGQTVVLFGGVLEVHANG